MYFAIGSVRQRAYCISSTATLHVAQSYLPSGVASIAYELGFQDQACFSRAFKRHAGMTPRQFRQQAAAEAADAC